MMDTIEQLFDDHSNGNHLQEKQESCLLCTSRHMVNPSSSETLEIYQYIKEVLWSTGIVERFPSTKYLYQLVSNLDSSLREKLFDEVLHGRNTR